MKGRNALLSEVPRNYDIMRGICEGGSKCTYTYEKGGESGENGGDSGKAGCGGFGGHSGKRIYIWRNKNNTIKIEHQFDPIHGPAGNNGAPGVPGLGGFWGDTAYRKISKHDSAVKVVSAIFSLGISAAFLKDKVIDEGLRPHSLWDPQPRASPGVVNSRVNCLDQQKSTQSQIALYERETEYLKYAVEQSGQFKYSQVLDHSFVAFVMNENLVRPEISSLIERFELLDRNENSHLLNNLINEIKDFIENKNPSHEEQLTLNYTLATIISTISRHSITRQTALVINIEKFLEETRDHIRDWNELAKQNVRDLYKKNYEANLKKKIDEANEIVRLLQEEIEQNEKDLNKNMINVIREITELKNKSYLEDKRLLSQKEKLEDALVLKSIFSGLKLATGLMSFLGPKGALVGSFLQAGVDIAAPLTVNLKSGGGSSPTYLDKSVGDLKTYMDKRNQFLLKKLDDEVKTLEAQNQIENNRIVNIVQGLSVEARLDLLPDSVKKYELKVKYGEYVQASTDQIATNAEKLTNERKIEDAKKKINEINANSDKTMDVVKHAATTLKVAKLSADLANEIKMSKNEIAEIDEQIKKNANAFHQLNDIENEINKFSDTILKDSFEEIKASSKNLQDKSVAVLDLKKWQVKKSLDDIRISVESLMKAFEGKTIVVNTINRVDNALTTMIDIYTRIESFVQQNELANYIEAITRTTLAATIPVKYQSKVMI